MKNLMVINLEPFINIEELLQKFLYIENFDIIVSLSTNSISKKMLKKLESKSNIELIKSYTKKHDSEDFMLITKLVEKLTLNKYELSVVISKDAGYDAFITHLKNNGYNIKKEPIKYLVENL